MWEGLGAVWSFAWNFSDLCRQISLLVLLTVLVPLCASAGESLPEGDPVARVEIRLPASDTAADRDARLAQSLIAISKGDPYSTTRFSRSLEALRLSGQFRAVHGVASLQKAGICLTYTLAPAFRISGIHLSGAYPFFRQELINLMSVYEGDVYDPAKIPAQIPVIEALFRKEGFPDPRVSINEVEDAENRRIRLDVRIEKGGYERLDDLRFSGQQTMSRCQLRVRCATWRNHFIPGEPGRFSRRVLQEDMKKLLAFYRENGFVDAKLTQTVSRDADGRVQVSVAVSEGLKYRFLFSGNKAIPRRHLKKELAVFDRGNAGGAGIRRSIKGMLDRYHDKGFASARIVPQVETFSKKGVKQRRVTFMITEGPQTLVTAITVKGNTAIDTERLKKAMQTKTRGRFRKGIYQPDLLDADVDVLKGLYRKKGYVNVRITSRVDLSDGGRSAVVILDVVENSRVRVGTVRVKGLDLFSESDAVGFLVMQPGSPYRDYLVQGDANILSAKAADAGYPHVTVTPEVTEAGEAKRDIVYHVEPGPVVTLSGVYVAGNATTRSRYIREELGIRSGDRFSLKKVLEGERRLRDLEIFQSVRVTPLGLKEKDTDVQLFVDVEDVNSRYVESGFGYDSAKGLYAHGKTGNRNLWGVNREVYLSGHARETGYRVEAGGVEPRLWGTHTAMAASVFMEKNEIFNTDFGSRIRGASVSLSRRYKRYVDWGTGLEWEYRDPYQRGETAADDGDRRRFVRRQNWRMTPHGRYDSRDSMIRPQTGYYLAVSADISSSITTASDNFIKYRFDARHYVPLGRKWVLALRGRWGYIQETGTRGGLTDDQLFYLGGSGDVRGYSENRLRYDAAGDPRGGKCFVSGSIEGRYRINASLELTLFMDTGSLMDSGGDLRRLDFRHGAGMGLGYQTPVGPIGFYYGRKVNPDSREADDRFHFFLGYPF